MVIAIRWCIPDVPAKLKEKIQRERYVTNEIIIAQETKQATMNKCSYETEAELEL